MKKTSSDIVDQNLFKKKYSSPLSDKEVMISQNYFINQININNLKNKIEESILNQREKSQHDSAKSKRDSFDQPNNNSVASNLGNSHKKRGVKSTKNDVSKAISPQSNFSKKFNLRPR
jgi:hypothetical protein